MELSGSDIQLDLKTIHVHYVTVLRQEPMGIDINRYVYMSEIFLGR